MSLLTKGTSLRQTADGEHNLKSLVTVDFGGLLVQDQGAGKQDPLDVLQNPQKEKEKNRKKEPFPQSNCFHLLISQLCHIAFQSAW